MPGNLSHSLILQAFVALDRRLNAPVTLILGGGGAMVMAHGYPLATADVDSIPLNISFEQLDPHVKAVARELNLPGDWLNPYFSTFTHVLPPDYAARVIEVFRGTQLVVRALGRVDMLILKCFAHRPKDLGHARALVKLGADVGLVGDILSAHVAKKTARAEEALEFLDNLIDEVEGD